LVDNKIRFDIWLQYHHMHNNNTDTSVEGNQHQQHESDNNTVTDEENCSNIAQSNNEIDTGEDTNSKIGIEQVDDDVRPSLDPRVLYDDSLDKVREKGTLLSAHDTSSQTTANTNLQSRSAAEVVDQATSNNLDQAITLQQMDSLGQLSQTQRRRGQRTASNNTIRSTQRRSLVGRIANSLFPRIYHDSNTLVEATLVVEDDSAVMGEVVEAQRVGYCARNWRVIGIVLVCILIIFAVLMSVSFATRNNRQQEMTYEPSIQPSFAPTPDDRPTFDIVRERGSVQCGISDGKTFNISSVEPPIVVKEYQVILQLVSYI